MASIKPIPHIKLLACDWANSVTGSTTTEGTIAFAHSPFGHRSPEVDDDTGPGYNGQHLERDGGYLLGHGYREYRPKLGRFNAPDSYSPFGGGGLNCYAYCRAEPVNRSDPSGHADNSKRDEILFGSLAGFMLLLGVLIGRGVAHQMRHAGRLVAAPVGAGSALGARMRRRTSAPADLGSISVDRDMPVFGRFQRADSPTQAHPVTRREIGVTYAQVIAGPPPPPRPPSPVRSTGTQLNHGGTPRDLLASILRGGQANLKPVGTSAGIQRDILPDLDALTPRQRFIAARERLSDAPVHVLAGSQVSAADASAQIRRK